jgi:hypothetical protein
MVFGFLAQSDDNLQFALSLLAKLAVLALIVRLGRGPRA